MANNKVQLADGTVLIDISSDTVTADKIIKGYTGHDATGAAITGILEAAPIEPIAFDYEPGYTNAGVFKYENSTNNHSDVYSVESGHGYLLGFGSSVGTRFRAAFLTTNPVGTSVDISGTQISQINNPSPKAFSAFIATKNGYCVVTKDNVSKKGIKSYLYDLTDIIQVLNMFSP